jgi:hypothetical protein
MRPGVPTSVLHEIQIKHDIDYVFWDEGTPQKQCFTMEMKAEREHTGNIPWEIASDKGLSPGWGMTTKADFLAFVFLDISRIYLAKVPDLRECIRRHRNELRVGKRQNYSRSGDPLNLTEVLLVPVPLLGRFVNYNPQALRAYDCSGETPKEIEVPR